VEKMWGFPQVLEAAFEAVGSVQNLPPSSTNFAALFHRFSSTKAKSRTRVLGAALALGRPEIGLGSGLTE
jgi:hypothetical protein